MLYELNSVNHMICIYLFQTGSRILSISSSVQYVIFKHSKPTAWIRVCGNAVSILRWHYISGLKCWTGIGEYAQWEFCLGLDVFMTIMIWHKQISLVIIIINNRKKYRHLIKHALISTDEFCWQSPYLKMPEGLKLNFGAATLARMNSEYSFARYVRLSVVPWWKIS